MIKAVGTERYAPNIIIDMGKAKASQQSLTFIQTDSFVRTEEITLNNYYEGMSQQQIKEQLFREFAYSGGTIEAFYSMINKLFDLGIISEELHDALGDSASDLLNEDSLSGLFYKDYSGVLMGYYETINSDIKDKMFDSITDRPKTENREEKTYELDYRKEVRAFMAELRSFMEQNGFSFFSA